MELSDFQEHSYLINDEKGLDDYGSSAYFIEESWLKKVDVTLKKEKENMEKQKAMKIAVDLLGIVSAVTRLSISDLLSKSRKREIIEAREIYCDYARSLGLSLLQIGRVIYKHHSTVIYLARQCNIDKANPFFLLKWENVGFRVNDYKRENKLCYHYE